MTGQTRHIVNVQLIHHLLAMLFHRFNADAKFGGDLLIGPALGDQLQDLRLACG
jgi:hypothetical protein